MNVLVDIYPTATNKVGALCESSSDLMKTIANNCPFTSPLLPLAVGVRVNRNHMGISNRIVWDRCQHFQSRKVCERACTEIDVAGP